MQDLGEPELYAEQRLPCVLAVVGRREATDLRLIQLLKDINISFFRRLTEREFCITNKAVAEKLILWHRSGSVVAIFSREVCREMVKICAWRVDLEGWPIHKAITTVKNLKRVANLKLTIYKPYTNTQRV